MGKYEIKIQINSTQKKINKNNGLINDYYKAINETRQLIVNLNLARNKLKLTEEYLKQGFTINNKTADNGELQILIENISSIITNLETNILSAMKEKINKLNNDNQNLKNKLTSLKIMYNKEQ